MARLSTELREGAWAHLRLDAEMTLTDLEEALSGLRNGVPCHVVVVSSVGALPGIGRADYGAVAWLRLFELPTVFAMEGRTSGAALEIALACDIRVCADGATFDVRSVTEASLPRVVGASAARGLRASGGAIGAATALRSGLVSEVALAGTTALEVAGRLAAVIASRGPIATKLAKEAIWRGLEMPLEQALRFETDLTLLLQTTKDRAEGVRAFVEKRAPQFTGE